MKLDGAVSVVIGGANGIGKSYCESLLEKKCRVRKIDLNYDNNEWYHHYNDRTLL